MKDGKLKIAVIGGGSSYTPELIEGFILRSKELPVSDLYLVDIEPGRHKLEIVGDLAKRMIEKAGLDIRLHLTFDRREAIQDSDFVTTQMRVGMLDARARDEHIPLRYDCIGQETTGAGGFAKALRTVPVILDICKDIEELAPNAMMFNFTNPAGLVTEAVIRHSSVRSVGLCNIPINTQMQVAKILGVDVSKVNLEWVGINHLNWVTRFLVEGKDVTEELLFNESGMRGSNVKNIPDFDWDVEFLRSLRSLPCSYLRYYYMTDKLLEEEQEAARTIGTRAEVVKRIEKELFDLYADPNLDQKPKQLEQRGGAYYSTAALNLMSSIFNDKRDEQIVNVRNNGILPFLPDDASIETNCVITGQGAFPVQIQTSVGPQIRGLIQIVKAYEELTVQAAVYGDYHAAIQALTIHPLVTSASVAEKILKDILAENKEYLPQFA
jgi:6-phospho-beta-glucosidase